jgi:hypothetical protein
MLVCAATQRHKEKCPNDLEDEAVSGFAQVAINVIRPPTGET